MVLGGDFNLVLNTNLDKAGGQNVTHFKSQHIVINNIDKFGLKDIWRDSNPDNPGYAWRRVTPNFVAVRLDFFLISDSLTQFVVSVKKWLAYKTDHSQVSLVLDFTVSPRGPGYWKLNTSYLTDPDYLQKINKFIQIHLNQEYDSAKVHWEIRKLSVTGTTVQFSSRKKKGDKNTQEALECKLELIINKEHNMPFTLIQSQKQQTSLIKRDLEELRQKKVRGAIVRSRARYECLGERPTKYFLNLEKKNKINKTIYRLSTKDGMITQQDEILAYIKEYYENLYTTQGPIYKPYLDNIDLPKISNLENLKNLRNQHYKG